MAVYTINHRKTIGKWQFIQFHYGLWYLYVFITFYNELVTGAILNQQTYLTGASHCNDHQIEIFFVCLKMGGLTHL